MRKRRVAVLGGVGLGDSLVEMVLAENARRAGCETRFFGDAISGLQEWFPDHRLEGFLPSGALRSALAHYDLIFSPVDAPDLDDHGLTQRWINYNKVPSAQEHCRVEHMVVVVRMVFGDHRVTVQNGLKAPAKFSRSKHARRVCLHPTSAEQQKNWPPSHFLELGRRLERSGYEVAVIMSAEERSEWEPIVADRFSLHAFTTLADCAAFVYESGYFVGNDSGGGHLAANLGIPTLSIHGRRKKARTWRPGWGTVAVVTPPFSLLGGPFRQASWKYLLPVATVHKRFEQLAQSIQSEVNSM